MSLEDKHYAEHYAEWLYKYRWYVIVFTILFIAALGTGARFLKMNTSYRVWFNEGSPEVVDYDNFRKRFAQDDALIIVFQDIPKQFKADNFENDILNKLKSSDDKSLLLQYYVKNDKTKLYQIKEDLDKEDEDKIASIFKSTGYGIFNNQALPVIQRLSNEFWKTKYVTRVDSLTNYSHTYVDGDNLEVKDLVVQKKPSFEVIKSLLQEHIPEESKEFRQLKDDLLASFLEGILSTTNAEAKEYIRKKVLSQDDTAKFTAKILLKKLPMNKREFESFIKTHISSDPVVIKNFIDSFFPTKAEVKAFLLENVLDDETQVDTLVDKILATKIDHHKLINPYIKEKFDSISETNRTMLLWIFPHLAVTYSEEQLNKRLKDIIDKLPPKEDMLITMIKPYVKAGKSIELLAEAMETAFPPYYDPETIRSWLESSKLSYDDLLDIASEVLLYKLPLTEIELSQFVNNNLPAQSKETLISQLSTLLYYTKAELKQKKAIALNEKLVKDLLISSDGFTTQLVLTPQLPDFAQAKTLDFLARIKDILKKESEKSGYDFKVAGLPEMTSAFTTYIQKDFAFLIPAMTLIILTILVILFRSLWGMMAPILVVSFSVIGTLGITGYIGWELNNITTMTPQILMAISIADSIHILTLFYRELHHGKSKREAIVTSIRLNFLPILLTSFTTAIGFLSLLTSIAPPIRVLGLIVAIGTMIAWFVSITFLPALLSVLIYSKKATHQKEQALKWTKGLGSFVIQYRRKILVVSTLITLVSAGLMVLIKVDNNPISFFKKGTYFRDATDFVDEKMKGGSIIEAELNTNTPDGIKNPKFLQAVDKLQQYLETTKEFNVTHTSSLVDILKTINKRLNRNDPTQEKIPDNQPVIAENLLLYSQSVPFGRDLNNQINIDQSAIRLTIRTPNQSDERNMFLINAINQYVAEHLKGLADVKVTGRRTIFTYTIPKISINMIIGILIALVTITIVLIITFKSFSIGLLSLIPNSIPLIVMFGLVGLSGTELNVGLAMVAMVSLGIVVDDTIHFLSKYLVSRRKGKTIAESVYQAFHDVGSAIIFTSVILTCGFGIFVFSNFGMNDKFGIFTAVTMLVALFFDLLQLPSLLLLGASEDEISHIKEKADEIYAND